MVHHIVEKGFHHHNPNNKRTRDLDANSTDDNRQYQSDIVPMTNTQKRKIDNSSSTLKSEPTGYQPLEDSTLLFLMDLVCKVVEKKEPVHSPNFNLSSDLISCSVSSNNSHCSSPQTTRSVKSSPIPIANDEYSNHASNNDAVSHQSSSLSSLQEQNRSKKPHRTSVLTIKELLN